MSFCTIWCLASSILIQHWNIYTISYRTYWICSDHFYSVIDFIKMIKAVSITNEIRIPLLSYAFHFRFSNCFRLNTNVKWCRKYNAKKYKAKTCNIQSDTISDKILLNYCYHGYASLLIGTCCFPTEIPTQFMVSYNQILVHFPYFTFSDSQPMS